MSVCYCDEVFKVHNTKPVSCSTATSAASNVISPPATLQRLTEVHPTPWTTQRSFFCGIKVMKGVDLKCDYSLTLRSSDQEN